MNTRCFMFNSLKHRMLRTQVDTIVNPQRGLDVQTYNGYQYCKVIEMFNTSIQERDWPQSAYWLLEGVRTGPDCKFDIIKRLLTLAVTETSHPLAVVFLDDYLNLDNPVEKHYENELVLMAALKIIIDTPLPTDTISLTERTGEFDLYRVEFLMFKLEDQLDEKRFDSAIETIDEFEALTNECSSSATKEWFKKRKEYYKTPAVFKFTTDVSHYIWLPILGYAKKSCWSQKMCNVIYRLHHIARGRSKVMIFRSDPKKFLFVKHAVRSFKYSDVVDSNVVTFEPPKKAELLKIGELHLTREHIPQLI